MCTYKSTLESGIHSNLPVYHTLSQSPEVNKKYTVSKTEFDLSIKIKHAVSPSRSTFSAFICHIPSYLSFNSFSAALCCQCYRSTIGIIDKKDNYYSCIC